MSRGVRRQNRNMPFFKATFTPPLSKRPDNHLAAGGFRAEVWKGQAFLKRPPKVLTQGKLSGKAKMCTFTWMATASWFNHRGFNCLPSAAVPSLKLMEAVSCRMEVWKQLDTHTHTLALLTRPLIHWRHSHTHCCSHAHTYATRNTMPRYWESDVYVFSHLFES